MPVKLNSAPSTQSFDYIICGGGTSGCVIATRLAENPNVTVLIIEAGKHNDLLENTKMVGGWSQLVDSSEDWNIASIPQTHAVNRLVKLYRGRFLGGSSGINGTLCVRGIPQDIDDWRVEGWSGAEIWSYMNKVENFHPKDWFKHDPKNHGTSGFLHTEPHDPAPITSMILKSMDSQGLPYDPDMFSTGNNPHGCGHAVRTVYKGIRSTAADIVTTSDDNLWVWTDTTVDKVNLSKVDGRQWKATSVDVIHEGSCITVEAKKEIIVCGGAYCSPAILLRSGIGSGSEVKSFGIESKVELHGVGKNLMDHPFVPIFYEVNKPGLTTDHLIYCADGPQKSYASWKEEKKGFLSTYPFGAFAFARLDERLSTSKLWQEAKRSEGRDPMGLSPSQPNIEFFTTECYGLKLHGDYPVGGKSSACLIIPELFGVQSRGTVTLNSQDPLDNPVVDPNYLSNPLDVLVLSEACKLANEIMMQGEGTKEFVPGAWPPNTLDYNTLKTREDWEPFVRESVTTCFHPAGTCKMGSSNDPTTVVDERLRVHGVDGLRVADASIIPLLHCGHAQMLVYAIGEKCADMIKEDNII